MDAKQFEQELKSHDWYFRMSDNMRVFDKGEANLKRLIKIAEGNEELMKLFIEYSNKY